MKERARSSIEQELIENDQEDMEQLAWVIPAIVQLEAEKHGEQTLPLQIYHAEKAKYRRAGGQLANNREYSYFLKFDMAGNQDYPVMTIEAMTSSERVDETFQEDSVLSILYDGLGRIVSMRAKGGLSLGDFSEILSGYLEDETKP